MDESGQTKAEQKRQRKMLYNRQYRVDHKEQLAERRAIKIECSCGKICSKRHLEEHMRSTRHQKQLMAKTEQQNSQ